MGTRRVSDEIVLFSRGAFWSYQQSPVGVYVINKARNEAKLNMAVLKKNELGSTSQLLVALNSCQIQK